ncbi:HORMA domain-containing protein 1, partial [Nowakowskiella sp. JEL0078]
FEYPSSGLVSKITLSGKKNCAFPATLSSEAELGRASQLMLRSLLVMMSTLAALPSEVYITMKLYYYDDATPPDYEPPGFRSAADSPGFYFKNKPLQLSVGDMNSLHHSVFCKMQTIADHLEVEDSDIEIMVSELQKQYTVFEQNRSKGISLISKSEELEHEKRTFEIEDIETSTQELISKLEEGNSSQYCHPLKFETPKNKKVMSPRKIKKIENQVKKHFERQTDCEARQL